MIKLIIASVLFILGTLLYIIATIGVLKFKYVLNRMHVAAIGDTLGIFLMVLGAAFYYGISFNTLKVIMVLLVFWLASPVSSHFLAKLEVITNPQAAGNEYEKLDLENNDVKEEKNGDI